MGRTAATLVLAVLVLGAGCGTGGPLAEESGGVTPAGVPGADPASAAYPDGLRPGGIDPAAAARGHRQAVANGSYVLTYTRRTVERSDNGTVERRSVTREFRVVDARRYAERLRSGPDGRLRSAVFADGAFRYERVGDTGAVFVRRPASGRDPTALLTGSLVGQFLARGTATVERRSVDGRPATVVTVRNVTAGPGSRLAGTATVVVRPDGLVERLNATLTRPTDDGSLVRVVRFGYERRPGLSVEPPAWYDAARRETGAGGPGTRVPGGVGIER